MRTLVAVAASAVMFGLVSGCQVAPGPSPTPSMTVWPYGPTAMCTPTPSGSSTPSDAATPCSDAELAEQKRMDALYAEAEKVYRAFIDADSEVIRSGTAPSAEVLALTTGRFTQVYVDGSTRSRDLKITARGSLKLVYARPAPSAVSGDSEVALYSCEDATGMIAYKAGVELGPGIIAEGITYFKRVDGSLKISWRDEKKVTACSGR